MLDYVDCVMLMDYRNFVTGPNGLIALAQPSVDYASQIGKKVIKQELVYKNNIYKSIYIYVICK